MPLLLIAERIFIRELPASEVCINSTSRTFSTYSSLNAGIPKGTNAYFSVELRNNPIFELLYISNNFTVKQENRSRNK